MNQFLKNISPFNNRADMPAAQLIVKKILAFCLCYILGTILATIATILVHFPLGKNMLAGEMLDIETMNLVKYYGFGLFSLVMLLYWKIVEKKPLAQMGLTKNFGSYFWGVILGVVMVFITICGSILTESMEYCGLFEKINVGMIVLFTGSFIIQGAMEEIFCRGFLLHALKEKTGVVAAVVVSTIMFILPHCGTLFADSSVYGVIGIVNLILISIIFSLLTLRYQSIWAACGLHTCWNAIIYCVLGLNISGNEDQATAVFDIKLADNNIFNGGAYGVEANVVTMAVLVVTIVLLAAMNQKAGKKA